MIEKLSDEDKKLMALKYETESFNEQNACHDGIIMTARYYDAQIDEEQKLIQELPTCTGCSSLSDCTFVALGNGKFFCKEKRADCHYKRPALQIDAQAKTMEELWQVWAFNKPYKAAVSFAKEKDVTRSGEMSFAYAVSFFLAAGGRIKE